MNDDFEIKGHKFKLNKIDTFKQFHIARKLGPILGDIFKVLPEIQSTLKSSEDMSEDEKLEALAKVASPVLEGFSKLSDEDADFVLKSLCSSVQIQQTHNWAWVVKDKTLLFDFLDLPMILQIAGRAFMFNLSGFFNTVQQTSHGGK